MARNTDLERIASIRRMRKEKVERDMASAMARRRSLEQTVVAAQASIDAVSERLRAIAGDTPLTHSTIVSGADLRRHLYRLADADAERAAWRGRMRDTARLIAAQDRSIIEYRAVIALMDKALIKTETLMSYEAKRARRDDIRREEARSEDATSPFGSRRAKEAF